MALDATDTDEDDRLLARYGSGDPAAAGLVVARFLPLAYRIGVRMLKDASQADDVAQEAMIRLFRMAPGWQPGPAKVTTWLYRVTVNLCADHLRKRPTLPLDAAQDVADGSATAEDRLVAKDRSVALDLALGDLPERQRLAVVLRHIEGLANPEIAEVMGIGTEAVESLIARGKRGLTAALAGQRAALGYDDD
ncbi:MAG: sigma-70 family RNA polymerase sigma factor [Albidovulum sp.]